MNIESFVQQRLICVAVIDKPEDAVPLTEHNRRPPNALPGARTGPVIYEALFRLSP